MATDDLEPRQPDEQPTLELFLTPENELLLDKLATWGRVVAIINIAFGILSCLTIFALALPLVVLGVFLILMGTRLNTAVANIRYAVYYRDSASFETGFEHLKSYLLYNGILLLLVAVLALIMFLVLLTAGPDLLEFYQQHLGAV